MNSILKALRRCLEDAARRNPAEVLFFSGGLDTSILAALAPSIPAIHVCLEDGGEDLPYAERWARELGLSLTVRKISVEEALDALPEVIRIRRTFDPALPNDLALYFAFAEARYLGFVQAMTGDGADELFAGYSFMFDLDLASYIPWLAGRMRFSASEIGDWFGVNVSQPYLDPAVVDLALTIPPELKSGRRTGSGSGSGSSEKPLRETCPPISAGRANGP